MKIIKRDGDVVNFDKERIRAAIIKAMSAARSELNDETLYNLVNSVVEEVEERFVEFYPNVENIQDIVEKHLVKSGFYEISKAYILYRAQRQKEREQEQEANIEKSILGKITVKKRDGKETIFDPIKMKRRLQREADGFESSVSVELILREALKNIFDGVRSEDLDKILIIAARSFIERDPAYSFVSAKLFLKKLYKEVIGRSTREEELGTEYKKAFVRGIQKGIEMDLLDKRLLEFNLEELSEEIVIERDKILEYMGVQTLYERYFMKRGKRLETPQAFWMRVAMGLSINEKNKNEKAKEFYHIISKLEFVPSTPTLFHAGTKRAQLSSCYLTTVLDDLDHIFKSFWDNAKLSKWSGGLGNDWSNLRGTGAWIKSTNIESQGAIPFLKIANDVTAAINRSGKRRGATCAYLEAWHFDFEDFIDLRRNTGDERRRTHDMNIAAWIPDLFMKRVINEEEWMLISPDEASELHHLYGKEFEKKYEEYEEEAKRGKIRKYRTVQAKTLWRKILTRLFETGHPWITFKDPCNIRSPQDHAGVVHSSNLCTEITLNTSEHETAVCNLGSLNLSEHVEKKQVDYNKLASTIKTAVRMLDNVIDLNFYPTKEAENSNLKHRPVGLGIMGFQDVLYKMGVSFDSPKALEIADELMEFISYNAILTSSELAKEREPYKSYSGSKWSRNLLPQDTIDLLENERSMKIEVSRTNKMDWRPVRDHIKKYGMRNSNVLAIAPTATISTIAGCYPSIEPIYKNIYVKANMSGEFTIVNSYLVNDLKKIGLWNKNMLDQIKYHDGRLAMISSIPKELKEKYKEAFEIDPIWSIKLTAARAKWIDQSQSHNIFMEGVSGQRLSDTYLSAWRMGLKTTYYLRTLGATQIEKATLDANKYGFTQKREYREVEEQNEQKLCRIDDPECEACQ